MIFMEKYYQQDQDPDSSGLDILAQLSIYVDSHNKAISFACDWVDSDEGIDYISEIFNRLKNEDLIDKVLDGLYQQCVLSKNLDGYNAIVNKISHKIQSKSQQNEALIKPTDITKLR